MKDTAYIFLFILFLICLVTSIVLFILQIRELMAKTENQLMSRLPLE